MRVLVTGAAGSIGSEIVRQARAQGHHVVCLDANEYGLYLLERAHTGQPLLTSTDYVLASVSNRSSLEQSFASYEPEIVYHAAALKQLPLLERNPAMATQVNVGGTLNVASLSVRYGVQRMVNISTDKAAAPVSVLGFTKRIAERAVQGCGSTASTKLASVRFGNVYDSRGSFVETLRWQLANGLPISLTDPNMLRFFMSIPQAAALVIAAGDMANAGEIFSLDMGEPVRIVEVIRKIADEFGVDEPHVLVTGARPGEKLAEQLNTDTERQDPTAVPGISVIQDHRPLTRTDLDALLRLSRGEGSYGDVYDKLKEIAWLSFCSSCCLC